MKKAAMKSHPKNFMAFSAEGIWTPYSQFVFGEVVSENETQSFDSPADLWKHVDTNCSKTQYLFTSDFTKTMGLANGFNEMANLGWSIARNYTKGPYIVEMTKASKTLHILDVSNYWPGKSSENAGDVYKAMNEYMSFCEKNRLGSFARTLSGQAFNAFRHRFMDTKIYCHDHEAATRLEGEAYFGGLVDCFKIGEQTGDLHILDFKSMYPSVMIENKYPVKKVEYWNHTRFGKNAKERISEVKNWIADDYAVIAKVVVNIPKGTDQRDSACLPYFDKQGLTYPTGEFTTVATTRELKIALERNYVTEIIEMTSYEQEYIFEEYVDFFWKIRNDNTGIYADMAKSFLNMLYGKFGQSVPKWMPVTDDEIELYDLYEVEDLKNGELYESFIEGKFVNARNNDGTCEIQSGKTPASDAFWAIAAHITADGRLKLRTAMSQAGWDNVFYGDTDSIHTNSAGLANLSLSDNPGLGELSIEKSFNREIIHGLKTYEYYTDDESVRKFSGAMSNAIYNDGSFTQTEYHNVNGTVMEKTVTKRINSKYSKGIVKADGTVMPFHLK